MQLCKVAIATNATELYSGEPSMAPPSLIKRNEEKSYLTRILVWSSPLEIAVFGRTYPFAPLRMVFSVKDDLS